MAFVCVCTREGREGMGGREAIKPSSLPQPTNLEKKPRQPRKELWWKKARRKTSLPVHSLSLSICSHSCNVLSPSLPFFRPRIDCLIIFVSSLVHLAVAVSPSPPPFLSTHTPTAKCFSLSTLRVQKRKEGREAGFRQEALAGMDGPMENIV